MEKQLHLNLAAHFKIPYSQQGSIMKPEIMKNLTDFIKTLGLDEEPMGLFHTDKKPKNGFTPKPKDLPTREKELNNEIDWQSIFGSFECTIRSIWLARRKQTVSYFSAENFGCAGASYWMGFTKPQTETIIGYVAEGSEHYCKTADDLRHVFEEIDPVPAPKKYCVIKPLSQFTGNETPTLVLFFTRPEALAGLHQLAFFVTNDPEVVASPWSAGCGGLVAWPMRYLAKGENKAVVGGWDPSARIFYKADELSFTVPFSMFENMIDQYKESFLITDTWEKVKTRIERSRVAWKK